MDRMQDKEELLEGREESSFLKEAFRYALFGIVVILLAIYVGLLLFGTNSVEVLYERKVEQRTLERNIEFLKKENARLQKEFFELKELEVEE